MCDGIDCRQPACTNLSATAKNETLSIRGSHMQNYVRNVIPHWMNLFFAAPEFLTSFCFSFPVCCMLSLCVGQSIQPQWLLLCYWSFRSANAFISQCSFLSFADIAFIHPNQSYFAFFTSNRFDACAAYIILDAIKSNCWINTNWICFFFFLD